jgi:hypothetical protein
VRRTADRRSIVNAAMPAAGVLIATGIACAVRCEKEREATRRSLWLGWAATCALLAAYTALIGRRIG